MVVEREYRGPIQGAIHDLRTLHRLWMAAAFPKLRQNHSVLGRWKPEAGRQQVLYYTWAILGGLALAVTYPLLLIGLATRFYSRRFDSAGTRLGLAGVLVVTAVVWGLLTLLARVRFSPTGFVAVAAASLVAVVSAGLSWVFVRVDGRPVTVLLAYPAAMNVVFLPPVVAALYSPALADIIFPNSTSLAIWLLDNVLVIGNLNTFFRETFELEGVAYVAMWFGIAVPLGWFFGIVVTVADLVRPKGEDTEGNADKVG